MKGIILAGGAGSRLNPLTLCISKQLLPVYDKPMIYYPLATLMQAGISEILIITTPEDSPRFKKLLGDGSHWGISISFREQESPRGIADAFIVGESFIKEDNVALILGDNIFHGKGLEEKLARAAKLKSGAILFAYEVIDPQRFGVVSFDQNDNAIDIQEKPNKPKSNFAVTGLYFYDDKVVECAKNLKPSDRGELEITDINQIYIEENNAKVVKLGSDYCWIDTGTHDSLLEAGNLIRSLEEETKSKIGCIEEIAYNSGWLNHGSLMKQLSMLGDTDYAKYLRRLTNEV
jgi:glucose-1-phosphate thymidylyltransferase